MSKQLKKETLEDIVKMLNASNGNQIMQPLTINGNDALLYINLQIEDRFEI